MVDLFDLLTLFSCQADIRWNSCVCFAFFHAMKKDFSPREEFNFAPTVDFSFETSKCYGIHRSARDESDICPSGLYFKYFLYMKLH